MVAAVVGVVVFLWSNTVANLSARRITTGFAFLGREAGMPIADSLLPYNPRDTYFWAFVVGVANTLRVAVIGIVLATILGTLIGISRLSANWLLSRLAAIYVEVLRDIPLLLQLLFWYVLMHGLPAARIACFAEILSAISAITSAGGPTKTRSLSTHASTNAGFSARKP